MRGPGREALPRFVAPMLATSASAPTGEEWAMEVKWDGIRCQLRFDGHRLCLRSRTGRECTAEFPDVDVIREQLRGRRVVLDGELVCLAADGKPDFAALRGRIGRRGPGVAIAAARTPVTLVVFDVLHLDGRAVRELEYWRRRELLGELLVAGPGVLVPRHFVGEGRALLAATADQGLEGVVAKRLSARYAEGRRSRAWVKQKHRRRERLVVTGWRERAGALPEFLLARRQTDGGLRPAGSASLGLDAARRASLLVALERHAERPRASGRGVRWTAPVIEVLVDAHGRGDGPVRDAIVREIAWPTEG